MDFNSLEEMISYIEKQMSKVSDELADKMVDIAKKETQREQSAYSPKTYNRTTDILKCIKPTEINKNFIEITWTDSGNWESYSGNHFYAPKGLEFNTTYGVGGYRPKTNFVELSFNKMDDEVPNVFKQAMKSKGIPIE